MQAGLTLLKASTSLGAKAMFKSHLTHTHTCTHRFQGGHVVAVDCLFDNNYAAGVENVNADLTMKGCVVRRTTSIHRSGMVSLFQFTLCVRLGFSFFFR
jgi:hypothetical protein